MSDRLQWSPALARNAFTWFKPPNQMRDKCHCIDVFSPEVGEAPFFFPQKITEP
jgi:hypothetical protein